MRNRRPDVPALTRGRLSWVQQNYVRAETIARANARLVDANSILEWRISPARLNDELARFLDDVHDSAEGAEGRRARERLLGLARDDATAFGGSRATRWLCRCQPRRSTARAPRFASDPSKMTAVCR